MEGQLLFCSCSSDTHSLPRSGMEQRINLVFQSKQNYEF